ncbi:Nucleoside-diphosphate-sugar epimerase [Halapricum desulfuricans]|uniref:Nucleoside-diphosphate-sugar epimerase n=1 Tax=Halapricum desulfuricans TaxID=2841257 RepID=A0A897NF79_9EURY|nr:NAD-dependent epimerase/dehydratase family protein [Halapricum desulfuricans]QSG11352.1 Nucleoside-diphosphate-sugar epimerase [Halapricum desulfuricans]
MDILVTGGAGFIGGHLAERFARNGHDVVVLDNFDPYYDRRLKEHNVEVGRESAADGDGSYRLVEGDVRDDQLIAELVADADYVYHQAAQAGVRADIEPRKYHTVNVDGTLNVLEAARRSDIERIVFASSSSVYGNARYLPYDEEHPTTPVSPYGASKLAAERYAMVYSDRYDIPVVSLRYFTVYGPRMRPNMAISNFVSRCMNGEPPVIYGDGSKTRDFTYIEDILDANLALLGEDAADGEVVNIGSSDTISIEQLAETVRDAVAPDLELVYTEGYDIDAEHTHAGIEKAHDLIGYEPSRTIEAGVAEFIEWYRANREWYEPLVCGE